MLSNFSFLSKKWRELYEVAQQAEKAVQIDPNAALIKLRLFGELVGKQIVAYESVYEPYRISQKERIDLLSKEGFITPEVHEMLDSIRLIGNKAVDEANYGSSSEAKRLLMVAFQLGGWLTQVYEK
jgi:type I restriction enzyme, R subunit